MPSTFNVRPLFLVPCACNASHPLLVLAKVRKSGAGQPNIWLKNFENFCEVLLNADFQNSNMLWFKSKYAYAEMHGNSKYPICNAMMDTYHEPHGAGSGFESRAGLSTPWVHLSSPGGVLDDDTFFRQTLLVVGSVSTSFFSDSRNFLRWILRLAFL